MGTRTVTTVHCAGSSETSAAQAPNRGLGRRNSGPRRVFVARNGRELPHRARVEHGANGRLNPDASRFCKRGDSGGRARRAGSAPRGSPGSAARPRAGAACGPGARRCACHSVGPGRTGGRRGPERGSARTERIGRSAPSGAPRTRERSWTPEADPGTLTPLQYGEMAQSRSHRQVRIGTAPALLSAVLLRLLIAVVTKSPGSSQGL